MRSMGDRFSILPLALVTASLLLARLLHSDNLLKFINCIYFDVVIFSSTSNPYHTHAEFF